MICYLNLFCNVLLRSKGGGSCEYDNGVINQHKMEKLTIIESMHNTIVVLWKDQLILRSRRKKWEMWISCNKPDIDRNVLPIYKH